MTKKSSLMMYLILTDDVQFSQYFFMDNFQTKVT